MDIIKIINADGTCKLEITSNNYNRDKQVIEQICEAAKDISAGNTDRIRTANETIISLLWQSTQRCANAMQKVKSLQETIEFDNMQIAHYDNELKQAETLLRTMLPYADAVAKFLNRGEHDDNPENPTDNS